MNTSYDYPEGVGIFVGILFFVALVLLALWGNDDLSSDYPEDQYCDQKTGCY